MASVELIDDNGNKAAFPAGGFLVDMADRIVRLAGRVSRGVADSVGAGGVVVAPGAGADIVTTANLAAGVWELVVTVGLGAGAVAADLPNLQLKAGAGAISVLALPGPGLVATFGPFRKTFPGASAAHIIAVAAGTAGVPYAATIAATRIE